MAGARNEHRVCRECSEHAPAEMSARADLRSRPAWRDVWQGGDAFACNMTAATVEGFVRRFLDGKLAPTRGVTAAAAAAATPSPAERAAVHTFEAIRREAAVLGRALARPAKTLSRLDLCGALLMPQVNPGSLHHCAKRTLRAVCGPQQEERGLKSA